MAKDFEISDDDREIWRQVSKTVEVLKNKEAIVPENIQNTKVTNKKLQKTIYSAKTIYTDNSSLIGLLKGDDSYKDNYKKSTDHIVGDVRDLDKSTAKKIINGNFTPDARLDLHGISQYDAANMVHEFIKNNYATQARKLIIITGKGAKNNGILKQKVPSWLNYSGVKELILLFSYAKLRDGGEGALYVLLKRKR